MKRWEVTAVVRRDETRRYITYCDSEEEVWDSSINQDYDLLAVEQEIREIEVIEAPLEDDEMVIGAK